MLADISTDRSILIPGEVVTSGKRRVVVYPLALEHFSTHANEVVGVLAAIHNAVNTPAEPSEKTVTVKHQLFPHAPVLIVDGSGNRAVAIKNISSVIVDGRQLVGATDFSADIEQLKAGFFQTLPGGSVIAPIEANITYTAMFPGSLIESAAKAVGLVLLTNAFRLLAACCVPPLDSASDPISATAAGAWAAASIDLETLKPQEPTEGESVPLDFSTAMQRLVAAGHSAADIISNVQVGIYGRPVPFRGWTLAQFSYWRRADDRRRARDEAEKSLGVAMAIGAAFGGNEEFQNYLRELRSV